MDIEGLAARFEENHGAVLEALKTAQKAAKEQQAKTDEVAVEVATVREEVLRLHQKGARSGGGGGSAATFGEQFVEADAFKAFSSEIHRPSRVRVEMKTVSSVSPGGGALIAPQRDMTAMMPQQPLALRSLLNVINVSSGTVEYARQTGRTNNANVVAELAAKPESNLSWTLQTVPIQVIAHWIGASRQVLDDATQLRDLINSELIYGVKLKEEQEILLGTGVSPHLHGIIPQATAFAAPITLPTPTMIDTIATAVLQLGLAGWQATGIALHPSDFARTMTLKDSTGQYIVGSPQSALTPMLWGIPVAICQSLAPDQFVVGDWRQATLYDRLSVRVEASTEHDNFFVLNMVALLCEERVALAVKSPSAFITGDLGNVA